MQIPVSSILQAQSPVTRYNFSELLPLPEEGEQLLEPITGEVVVERVSDDHLQVKGDFQTRLRLLCHRCGESYETTVTFQLDEALVVVSEAITADEVEDRVATTGNLDATDLIRQTLLLSLPTRQLCGCEPKASTGGDTPADPRWAALQTFTPQSNGKPTT